METVNWFLGIAFHYVPAAIASDQWSSTVPSPIPEFHQSPNLHSVNTPASYPSRPAWDGMDVLHLQALLSHASLEMVQHYAQMVDENLLSSHQAHSPIDNLLRFMKR